MDEQTKVSRSITRLVISHPFFGSMALSLKIEADEEIIGHLESNIKSYQFNNTKLTVGMGWGKFTGKNSFKNPLSELSSSFLSRPLFSDNYNFGGSLSYDQWFRGNASIFGGLEWRISNINGLNFKLEYDPFNYFDFSASDRADTIYEIRKKESNQI